jgi:GT2 family glycosyltransferase/glycosyltransferase involved in cell wall biosynthesis
VRIKKGNQNTLVGSLRSFSGKMNSLRRLIKRAFKVLRNEGVRPFFAAIVRKILFFVGLRPKQMSLRGVLQAITINEAITHSQATKYDVIIFPIIDWYLRIQRPQQLAMQFADAGHRVFYISPTFQEINTPIIWPIHENIYGVLLPGQRDQSIYASAMGQSELTNLLKSFRVFQSTVRIYEAVCLVDLPFWTPLAMSLREKYGWKIIYDCMDEHADFSETTDAMLAYEEELTRESDLVLATSHVLLEKARKLNPHTLYVPNAGDFEHFNVVATQPEASSGVSLRPQIGYYGAIADWFDDDLVVQMASARQDWDFILIGNLTDPKKLLKFKLPNIKILGEKPYSELPRFLKSFDVCIIPFKKTALTEATNPVKLFEYLSAGKPVVATELNELSYYADQVHLASTLDAWLAGIQHSLDANSAEKIDARIEFARQHSWRERFNQLSTAVVGLFPKASLLIITYNNLEYTTLCLDSIYQKTNYPNFEVIIVDNASTDGTVEYLAQFQAEHTNCLVVFNDKNRGFAAANNQAARRAQGEYLVFLNNDTIVTRGWLSGLLLYLRDPAVGMVGPVTNHSGNESRINVSYQDISEMDEFALQYMHRHWSISSEISMLAFFCVVIPKRVWGIVGELDEQYGIGMFEDDDYALRVKEKGLKILCVEDVFIHHWGSASFSKLEDETYQRTFQENRKKFEAKWNVQWQPHKSRVIKN